MQMESTGFDPQLVEFGNLKSGDTEDYVFIEKNPHICVPTQFKPVLFENQLLITCMYICIYM